MNELYEVLKYYVYYKYCMRFVGRKGLEKRKLKRIEKHLQYVSEHSKVYRGIKELSDCPVIDKAFMMKHFSELNTVGIEGEEAEAFAVRAERERDFVPKLKNVTVGLSSGTSGQRGIFLVSDQERLRWAGYVLAKFLPNGIWKSCSIAFFMRADSNLYQSVGKGRIRFYFFDIYQDMGEHWERLERVNPQVLVGQPSILLAIAREKVRIYPKMVISIAEVLEKQDERRLAEAFGVNVIHQAYQCTEGFLASTCKYGTLHLNEDIVHIEREYLDEDRFVPVVTDFERKAQPIIRYRLNDILVEKKGLCKCKSPCRALEKIEGREDDVFYFKGRDGTERRVFPDFIRRCVLFAENGSVVSDYRVVQEENGAITVYGDLTENGTWQVKKELEKLAEDRDFILPEVYFEGYRCEPGKKMKRVERICLGRNRQG
ncbi:F390 synthetase-related protein [Candidatus Ventrimonas sp. KK005]|nr:hypothetical protein [Clostridiaceae bacterium]